jgi:hypothetical protein
MEEKPKAAERHDSELSHIKDDSEEDGTIYPKDLEVRPLKLHLKTTALYENW